MSHYKRSKYEKSIPVITHAPLSENPVSASATEKVMSVLASPRKSNIRLGSKAQEKNIYLFGVLCRFQHCRGHIRTGSWKGRGDQYIQFVRVLYCKLPTNGMQLPAFPLEAVTGTEPRPQRWDTRVLPLQERNRLGVC